MRTLDDFTAVRVRKFLNGLRKQTTSKKYDPKKANPATVQTKNLYQMTVKSFDIWLCQQGLIPKRRLKDLKKLKFDEHGNRPVSTRNRVPLPKMDDVELLWKSTLESKAVYEGYDGKTRYRAYVLAPATGYRRKELGTLTPKSFNLIDNEVAVPGQFTKNGDQAYQPIPEYLVPTIQRWLQDHDPNQPLFPNLEKKKTANWMYRDLVEAGLQEPNNSKTPIMDFHRWRHLYITNCWTSGATPDVVQRMARHRSQRTTQGYTHVRDKQRHEAANKMARLPVLEED